MNLENGNKLYAIAQTKKAFPYFSFLFPFLGRNTENTNSLPFPGALSTQIFPLCLFPQIRDTELIQVPNHPHCLFLFVLLSSRSGTGF